MQLQNLFTYGTLQKAPIQLALFQRLLSGRHDQLPGYRLGHIEIMSDCMIEKSVYKIITPCSLAPQIISGMVYEVTVNDLLQADEYEGVHYKRISVQLNSGLTAWVYTAHDNFMVNPAPFSPPSFYQ